METEQDSIDIEEYQEYVKSEMGSVNFEDLEEEPELPGIVVEEAVVLAAPLPKLKVFPGDLVSYRANKPYEWTVWYGKTISPQDPLVAAFNEMFGESKLEAEKTTSNDNGTKASKVDNNVELEEPFYVQWNHSNRIGKLNKTEFGIVDRTFNSGTRVVKEDGIKGTVISTSAKVDALVLNSNYVIQDIPISHLKPISPFVRGREILYHGWIGVITSVTRSIAAKFQEGPKFDLVSVEFAGFMKNDPYWVPATPYPGNRTQFTSTALKHAKFHSGFRNFVNRWIPLSKEHYATIPCTITAVDELGVEVKWIQKCPAYAVPNASDKEPEQFIKRQNFMGIKLLGIRSSDTIEMNSVRKYPIGSSVKIISYASWFNSFQSKILRATNYPSNKLPLAVPQKIASSAIVKGYDAPVRVISKESFAEVEWDNGEIEKVKCTNLSEVFETEEADGFPIGLIVKRNYKENSEEYGIVQPSESAAVSNKRINVRWFLPNGSTTENETKDLGIWVESIYDIKPHPKLSLYQKGTILYFLGDLNKSGLGVGTVIDLDICHGKIILSVPNFKSIIWKLPHEVTPMSAKAWSDMSQKWIVEPMLPPLHQIVVEDGFGNSKSEAKPISLTTNNNNSSNVQIVSGSIFNLPSFEILDSAPYFHRYFEFESSLSGCQIQLLLDEANKIENNLPEWIWVRGYDSRMDLFSAVILGPEKTPHEDGLYFFDIQISSNFPTVPPKIHYVNYTGETISPFIAQDGTFCVSKLKWEFNEPPASFIAYALAQVQEIVFTPEPFEGPENSRVHNEKIYLDVFTSLYKMAERPYETWRQVITEHLATILPGKINTLTDLLSFLKETDEGESFLEEGKIPECLSFPISEGFRITLARRIENLSQLWESGKRIMEKTVESDIDANLPAEIKIDVENENPIDVEYDFFKSEISEASSTTNRLNKNSNENKEQQQQQHVEDEEETQMI